MALHRRSHRDRRLSQRSSGEPEAGRLPRQFASAVTWVGLALLFPLVVFFVSCWLLGWRLQPVLTGSMTPTYEVGSLMVVTPVDVSDVGVGTTIAFSPVDGGERLVSHRVIERLELDSGIAFRTQGDANRMPDAQLVPARQVRGRVRWHVVGLGRWLRWLEWPRGLFVLVVPALAALVVGELRGRIGARRSRPLCPACCLHAPPAR